MGLCTRHVKNAHHAKYAIDQKEDHFIFLSEDKRIDPWFVELCNEKIMAYYAAKGFTIKEDIEFTDGCGHQFKSKKAGILFVMRPIKGVRIYFETAHGKSKSDGAGGVTKSQASSAVASGKVVIRNCEELFDFCREVLTVVERSVDEGPMNNRTFFKIEAEEIEQYRADHALKKYYPLPQTLKIHQISIKSVKQVEFIPNHLHAVARHAWGVVMIPANIE